MLPCGYTAFIARVKGTKMCLKYLYINAHCPLGYRQNMSEIIQLISYENNERLGSDCLSNQNDLWNSNLSKNRPTCVFIGSFSISDVAIFGCVIDKQYDSLLGLISFRTARNLITFYKPKYYNTKYINCFY